MKVVVEGKWLENGSYHSKKTNSDVPYTTLLIGAQAVQVSGTHVNGAKYLDPVKMQVDIRVYNNNILCSYCGMA